MRLNGDYMVSVTNIFDFNTDFNLTLSLRIPSTTNRTGEISVWVVKNIRK